MQSSILVKIIGDILCIQCEVDSYVICEIFPGWTLQRAKKTVDDGDCYWEQGRLALVKHRSNNPAAIFDVEPVKDDDGMLDIIEVFDNNLKMDPVNGFELIKAALSCGYPIKTSFGFWLMRKITEAVEKNDNIDY